MDTKKLIRCLPLMLALPFLWACEQAVDPQSGELHERRAAHEQSSHHASGDREFYQARIEPVGDSRMRGNVQIRIEDGIFKAKVRATGAEPEAIVPQHIHLNPTCDNAGGILIAFDDELRVPGEDGFEGGGENYPRANRGGVVQYEAERSLAEILDALGLPDLNLSERVFNLHEPGLPVIGCGEIRRIR